MYNRYEWWWQKYVNVVYAIVIVIVRQFDGVGDI